MMPHVRRASLWVALLLLGSVSTASAQCAWVLWTPVIGQHGYALTDQWSPIRAYDTRVQCETALNQADAAIRQGNRSQAGLLCLPDTMDPRGAKGK